MSFCYYSEGSTFHIVIVLYIFPMLPRYLYLISVNRMIRFRLNNSTSLNRYKSNCTNMRAHQIFIAKFYHFPFSWPPSFYGPWPGWNVFFYYPSIASAMVIVYCFIRSDSSLLLSVKLTGLTQIYTKSFTGCFTRFVFSIGGGAIIDKNKVSCFKQCKNAKPPSTIPILTCLCIT